MVTASSAASTLVAQLRRIGGGRPCVLVAHSMGGVVATAAEQAPELVAERVYVTAFAPVSGAPAAAYVASPENAGERVQAVLAADPAAVGALRMDPGDVTRHRDMREAFYHDVDEVTAEAALSLLSPDAPAGVPGEAFAVSTARYGRIPHTYVVCTEDRAILPALQRRFVTEIDAVSTRPTTVVELATSHSPFLSAPETLAEIIATSARPAAITMAGNRGAILRKDLKERIKRGHEGLGAGTTQPTSTVFERTSLQPALFSAGSSSERSKHST